MIGPVGLRQIDVFAKRQPHHRAPRLRQDGGENSSSRPGRARPPRSRSSQVRKQVGMVFQRPNPLPLSIRDNVLFGARLHSESKLSKADEESLLESSLQQVLLWDSVKDRLNRTATELSLEEQQKLCIARLLPVKPTVLLMDEPCSALDSERDRSRRGVDLAAARRVLDSDRDSQHGPGAPRQ